EHGQPRWRRHRSGGIRRRSRRHPGRADAFKEGNDVALPPEAIDQNRDCGRGAREEAGKRGRRQCVNGGGTSLTRFCQNLFFRVRTTIGKARIFGWGARIRTWEWRNQNPLPYHLATPQSASDHTCRRGTDQSATRSYPTLRATAMARLSATARRQGRHAPPAAGGWDHPETGG